MPVLDFIQNFLSTLGNNTNIIQLILSVIIIFFLVRIAIQDYKTTYINVLELNISYGLSFVLILLFIGKIGNTNVNFYLENHKMLFIVFILMFIATFIGYIGNLKIGGFIKIKNGLLSVISKGKEFPITALSDIGGLFVVLAFLIIFGVIKSFLVPFSLTLILFLLISYFFIKRKHNKINYINNIISKDIKTIEQFETLLEKGELSFIKGNFEDKWNKNKKLQKEFEGNYLNFKPGHVILSVTILLFIIYINIINFLF